MAIEIPDGTRGPTTWVVKRTTLGEVFLGTIITTETRPIKNAKGEIQTNERTGNPRQELVVHALVMPGTTVPVGKGEEQRMPAVGEEVRLIFRGGGFGSFIDARKTHRDGGNLVVGDLIASRVDYAQAYNQDGSANGERITDQNRIVQLKMAGKTVGLYGPVQLAVGTDPQWIAAAEQAYRKRTEIVLDGPPPVAAGHAPNPEPFPAAQAPVFPAPAIGNVAPAPQATTYAAPPLAPQPAAPASEAVTNLFGNMLS